MFVDDFILNGRANGPVAGTLAECRFEPGLLRPYIGRDGRRRVTINTGRKVLDNKTGKYVNVLASYPVEEVLRRGLGSPALNSGTTLLKQSWIEIDRTVVKATRQRLRAWTDLAASSTRSGFDAMSNMTLEYQSMTDPGEAVVDMDAVADARADRPLFDLKSVPLPITHSDFFFTKREIAVSRNRGTPLDTTMAEAAGRRIGELVEQTVIGTVTGVTYGTRTGDASVAHTGTSTVYGYTNFPYRVTKTDLTVPTGANPEAVMTDVLEMVETMHMNGYYGPYMLYHSTGYSRYLNDDYFRTGSTSAVRSLRERIMEIEGISDIRRLDYLTSGYQMILVQMSPEVAQAINGMDVTTVQWEEKGGMLLKFKVMAIMVPLLKTPYNGTAGIIHATTS